MKWIQQMRISSDDDAPFVLIKFQVIKIYVDTRYATYLKYLTTKEIFLDWEQSVSRLSDIYVVAMRRFHDDDVEWNMNWERKVRTEILIKLPFLGQ